VDAVRAGAQVLTGVQADKVLTQPCQVSSRIGGNRGGAVSRLGSRQACVGHRYLYGNMGYVISPMCWLRCSQFRPGAKQKGS
jgi:hypothetical protein